MTWGPVAPTNKQCPISGATDKGIADLVRGGHGPDEAAEVGEVAEGADQLAVGLQPARVQRAVGDLGVRS